MKKPYKKDVNAAKDRRRSVAHELLRDLQLEYKMHNMGHHLVIEDKIDWWPGTGKWNHRVIRERGQNAQKLHEYLQLLREEKKLRRPTRPVPFAGMYAIPPGYERTGELWLAAEVERLTTDFREGVTLVQLAREFQRTPESVVSMLVRLNLVVNKQGRVYRLIFWGTL